MPTPVVTRGTTAQQKRWYAALAAVALAGVLAVGFGSIGRGIGPDASPSGRTGGDARATMPDAANAPHAAVAASAAGTPTAPAGPSRELQAAFLKASDWRAFVMDAMKRPGEGGYFYAAHAMNYCGRDLAYARGAAQKAVAGEIADTGTMDPRVAQQRERMLASCAAFAEGEVAQLSRDLKARAESERSDPLYAADRGSIPVIQRASRDDVRAMAARLLELDDPLLLSGRHLLYGIATADAEARSKSGLIFDGQLITVAQEPEYTKAAYALQLGACKPNAPCAADDEIRFACTLGRYCPADREADVRHRLSLIGVDDAGFAQVLAMAARVRRAVEERNVAFFVR